MSTQEFIFSNPSPDATPIVPAKKKRNGAGGRPKSFIWGDHAIQGKKVSEGHYEATCVYCDCFWKKGSPQDLEAHFANDCSKVPADTRQFFLNRLAAKAEGNITNLSTKKRKLNDGSTQKKITEFHESSHISEDRTHEINRACVKAFVLKRERPEILSTAVLTVLRSRAFFDDVRALAFTLRPIKQSIAELESQSCTLADCFLGLAKLGAAIKILPNNDYRTFRQQCISIFNHRYAEFADPIYLLCFFLHPSHTEICWARGTFRNLLITADEIFMKMGKNNAERKELMYQMKKYRYREEPFDIEIGATETPYTWWFSIEDSFPENEDYLVQLALKLFSITPHAAGCERVWSSLELPYYGIKKSTEEIHQILVDAHLNPDQDLLELEDNLLDHYNNEEEIVIEEEEELEIDKILNLDVFVNTLGNIIEDSVDNIEEEVDDNRVDIPTDENENDIEWDPAAEADEIVNNM
ncbi:unnamed protein product [Rhizophagus irregularis]|uniref:HAT C-terminal dimerisation domain-containing protein n=1 Tax=Rhizophagus irregularis TaxID=588596 RepID=A0A915YUZ1_9GLOM|nr:unnamed protein product [Rhizophagus irregularis]